MQVAQTSSPEGGPCQLPSSYVTVDEVIRIAASLSHTTPNMVMADRHRRSGSDVVTYAAIVVVARDHLKRSFQSIGRGMDRHHTSILHAYHTHGRRQDVQDVARNIISHLSHRGTMQTAAIALPRPTGNPAMERERAAARAIIAALAETLHADDELKAVTIEGETALFEAIDTVIERIANRETMIEALEEQIERLKARKSRFEAQITRLRTELGLAMTDMGLRSIERPMATLSTSVGQRSVVIHDETKLPEVYMKPGPPKPDKKALMAVMREGALIPGAMLSNGGTVLTIRFK